MIHLREILNDALNSVKLGEVGESALLYSRWNEIVGNELSGITAPGSIEKGRLVIKVYDPAFMEAMEYGKGAILKRITADIGIDTIKEIRLQLAERDER